jgi:hypothetical protein
MITITRVKQATFEFIKVIRYGKSDVQTSDQVSPHGIDSKPVNNDLAVHSSTSNSDTTVILGYIKKFTNTKTGETRIYSTNASGVEQFDIFLKDDGTCEIGGNTDNAVRFSELKAGFDQLRDDFNSFLTHVHGSAGTPPVPPVLNSTASVDDSKIVEVKVS